jgi:hypothetical protein
MYDAWFEKKYIVQEIESPIEAIQDEKEKIKYLKSLLYESINYAEEAKFYRNCCDGPHTRLDNEADEFVKTVKKEFTQRELEEAHKKLMKK